MDFFRNLKIFKTMIKNIKLFLVFIIGLLFGVIIHSLVEILAVWVLLSWLSDWFFEVPWTTWYWVHVISLIILEIFGLVIVFLLYRKYEK